MNRFKPLRQSVNLLICACFSSFLSCRWRHDNSSENPWERTLPACFLREGESTLEACAPRLSSENVAPVGNLRYVFIVSGRGAIYQIALHEQLLRQASGLSGRRLKNFRVRSTAQRITELIEDFSPLRALPAFQTLETEVQRVVSNQKWA